MDTIGFNEKTNLDTIGHPHSDALRGLHPYTNYADYRLLTQPINSTNVMQRMAAAGVGNGGLLLPHSGFPLTNSLQSALYPYPQFSVASTGLGGVTPLFPSESPTGNSRYDSLPIKATTF